MRKSTYEREPQELLADYADALRDGRVPRFLRALTRREAKAVVDGEELGQAMETVQILNQASFADKAVMPDMGLFIARVDAKIAWRLKHGRAHSGAHRRGEVPSVDRAENGSHRL
jgi:hypothetical protein